MRYPIRKEKSDLLIPVSGNGLLVTFRGNLQAEDLKNAVLAAAKNNWMLSCKAVRNEDGASLQSGDAFSGEIAVEDSTVNQVIAREEKRRFAIEEGELARFFILTDSGKPKLLIYAHPAAGDGVSLALLAEDILRCLSGEMPVPRTVSLVQGVYSSKAMPFYQKQITALLRRSWQKRGKQLSWEDAKELYGRYWQKRESRSFFRVIDGENYERLTALSKIHGSSLSAAVATAFLKASGDKTTLKFLLSLRGEEVGMGDFETDLWMTALYNSEKNFWENAKALQKLLEKQYHDPKKLGAKGALRSAFGYELAESAAFYAFGQLSDFPADMASRMLGYRTPGGLGFCDLQSLPIPVRYREWSIDQLSYIPALTPDLKKTVGVSVLGGRMTLSLHVLNDSGMMESRTVFEKAADALLAL